MIDWIIIISLILTGIAIIIAEIIFVPGTTVVGFFGFFVGVYGVYRSYDLYGSETGNWVLIISTLLTLSAIYFSFRSNAWERFAQKGKITSKVNENLTSELNVGEEGITLSSLKPIGKAEFGYKEFEVSSLGNFIEENTPVKILKIERNKIHVEPINSN